MIIISESTARSAPTWCRLTLIVFCLQILFLQVLAAKQNQRPFTPDDIFQMEELSTFMTRPAVFSPDGELLVYVLIRPEANHPFHNQPYMVGNDRADIWLANVDGGAPKNLTNGATDGSGYWAPQWSADGRFLAMYCTSGDNIYLCVWERGKTKIRRLGQGGLDILFDGPVWLSSNEIVVPALPPGQKALSLSILKETPEQAIKGWSKVRSGMEPTASVLESGIPKDLDSRPKGSLLLFNVVSGEVNVLFDGDTFDPVASPGGDKIAAAVKVGFLELDPDKPLLHRGDHGIYELRLFDRNGMLPANDLAGLGSLIRRSVYWSPDGNRLAFAVDSENQDTTSPVDFYVVDSSGGDLQSYSAPGLNPFAQTISFLPPPQVQWTSGDGLLIYARDDTKRMDWWLIRPDHVPENLTASMDSAPAKVYLEKGWESWVGISEGDVWRIPAGGGQTIKLTAEFDPKVTEFVWVGRDNDATTGISEAVIQATDATNRQEDAEDGGAKKLLYQLELTPSHNISPLSIPGEEAKLLAASSPGEWLASHEIDREGTILWLSRAHSSSGRKLFETNTFLQEVAEAKSRLIRYKGLEGDNLVGWLLLPPGYEEGKRYPMVSSVYAGSVMNANRPRRLASLNRAHPLNLQLLAARGYVVLVPSMPLKVQGAASDPYLELTRGVIPAIDRAIELGIADPERLAVMGQSYGGYSTMGLITLTNRFKAAISMAGLSNLVSIYGQLSARRRYSDHAHESLFGISLSETGQLSMGGPPWQDLQRYIRNSPISHVHRVETPILIIQGDLDYVPIQQGEEFFVSLLRQNKRARFVRYWGEGHVFHSPANIKHMWEQIYSWLDTYLAEESDEQLTETGNGGQ